MALIPARVARYPLLTGRTRLQRLARTEIRLGREGLWVKRDDETGIAIGGNKLRSLEFWLGEALAEEADVVIVAGGAASNQCRLTAAAAAIAGLSCIVCHNAADTPAARQASALNRLYGAEVHFLGAVDEHERSRQVEQLTDHLRRAGRRPYIVGKAGIGALGYVAAAEELLAQAEEAGAGIRHVFLPGSMGTTEAGFIAGNIMLGNPFEVHLVSVEYERDELARRITGIVEAVRGLLAPTAFDAGGCRIHYHMDHLGAGYGMPTRRSEAAILEIARTEGFLIEHTYTSKTFACFLDMARDGRLPAGDGACIIHTGGVPALFSQWDSFSSL